MLSLAEETTLLLYSSVVKPDGARSYDVFSKYGEPAVLVTGAVLMDLALRGRVGMVRPQSPEQRTRNHRFSVIGLLLALVVIVGPLVAGFLRVLTWPQAWLLIFIDLTLVSIVVRLVGNLRSGRMAIQDTTPTGDELLDTTLQGMARIGRRRLIKVYIKRHFRIRRFAAVLAQLREQLQAAGLVTDADRGSLMFGLVEVKIVNRDTPAFRDLGERVRAVILGGAALDPRAVALVCLFAREPRGIVLGRSGRALQGIYQFFHQDEYTTVKTRLAEIRRGDPIITALLGNDLYDTLIAIVYAIYDLLAERSSGGG
jgi:hypothetical protein